MRSIHEVGPAIKFARIEKKMTQARLAERIGVTINYLSLLETGHRVPSLPVLYAIADALATKFVIGGP